MGFLCIAQGRWQEAEGHLAEALTIAERNDKVHWRVYVMQALAELELWRGDPQKALDRVEPLRQNLDIGIAPSVLGLALLEVGDEEEAAAKAAESLDRATVTDYRLLFPEIRELCGAVATRLRRWEEAERHFVEGLSHARRMGMPFHEARLLYRAGLMHSQRGDLEQGRERLEESLAIFLRLGAQPYLERTEQVLASFSAG
jgi:tetratricopeptide (TPR) repeat protein